MMGAIEGVAWLPSPEQLASLRSVCVCVGGWGLKGCSLYLRP